MRPRFVGFSDSFVASVPLRNDRGDLVPIISVFSTLCAASILMLTSLASKHTLRGGVEVGLATEIGPDKYMAQRSKAPTFWNVSAHNILAS